LPALGDITHSRFQNLIKRTFALKVANPARFINDTITASHEVNDAYQPEQRYNRGERLFSTGRNLTNTAAVNFGFTVLSNNPGTGRMFAIKRVTLMGVAPTVVTQPGQVWFGMQVAVPNEILQSVTGDLKLKDSRNGNAFGTFHCTDATAGITSLAGSLGNSVYLKQLILGAATGDLFHQVDNLDVVIYPGTSVNFRVQGDTLPAVTYTWSVFIEGFERSIDPSETLAPPP